MHIAILETGRTNSAMPAEFGDYPDLFMTFFKTDPRFDDFTFSVVPVMDGVFPNNVNDYDGYLVTGSKTGVYDDEPWIAPLSTFIRDIHKNDIPLVGICFGHQIIAHALGGHAAKSQKGWGLGIRTVPLNHKPDWIEGADDVRLIHVHQDQVEKLPEGATLLGGTDFCPMAIYAIGDNVFSMQGHPEFTVDYTDALIDIKSDVMGADRVADARTTFPDGHDGLVMTGWIMNFYQNHAAHQSRGTSK